MTQQNRHPNLLFVFADQLGRNHCGFAGETRARTPNIDRLAHEGVQFVNAVANSPVCAAFRASLLTGQYTTTTGMVINELRLRTTHDSFGHALNRAGCETAWIGKWHLYANQLGNHCDPANSFVPPGPNRLGFDGYWAAYNFHHDYYDACYHLDTPEKVPYGDGVYEPDGQTDLMIRWLEQQAPSDKPFAAFLSYGTPHDPWVAENVPDEYEEMFQDVEFPNPPNYEPTNDDPYADAWAQLGADERERLPEWRRRYYAMTANLDWNIGRLLEALEKTGRSRDTIVVFTSDHGEMFGAHGRRAKNIFYDEAVRIPFIIRMPGRIEPGRTSDACLSTVDMMPTVLSLMGIPVPEAAEGMDLSGEADGRGGREPDAALLQNTGACAAWQNGFEWRALRDKRYTYAVHRRDDFERLYDNFEDPGQTHNLVGDPKHAVRLDDFRRHLTCRMVDIEDTFETCTWYRDQWTRERIILRGARG